MCNFGKVDKVFVRVAVFIVVCFLITGTVWADAARRYKVLVLNSYHKGHPWTDSIVESIQSEFNKSGLDIEPSYEYMDTKRYRAKIVFPYLRTLYKSRYSRDEFEVIIVSNKDALEFFRENQNRSFLFPDTPVVFCGVEKYALSVLEGQKNITGVIEGVDVKGTVDLALRLHPRAKRIVVVDDHINPTTELFEQLRDINQQVKLPVEFVRTANVGSTEKIREMLSRFPSDSVVLLSSSSNLRFGISTIEENVGRITRNCNLPVYTFWDSRVVNGVVGGVVISGQRHGSAAAQMTLRIMRGESADTIPILYKSPNAAMVDYNQLKRFGISRSKLPEGTIILNEPKSFYYRHKTLIWTIAAFVFFQSLVIIALGLNIVWRRLTEEKLRESEAKYKVLFEKSAEGIIVADVETMKFVYVNPAICEMLGYTETELLGKGVADIHPKESLEYVAGEFYAQSRGEKILSENIPCLKKDGTVIYVSINTTNVLLGGRKCNIGFFTDVTERKKTEQELQKARDELEIRVERRTADLARANVDLRNEISERRKIEKQLLVYQKQLRSLASDLSLSEEQMRRKMAIDIHDHISQNLAMSKMKVESLAESPSSSEVAETLNEIHDLISQAIESTRHLTFELSPPVLYELGFEAAIDWLVRQMKERHGIAAEFKTDGKPKLLEDNIKVFLFQAVRELLVNVAKHAKAQKVSVSVQKVKGEIQVSVEDDGIGFDVSGTAGVGESGTRGFGLFSIRERLGYIGGRVNIESGLGRGTCVVLVAPIDHNKTGEQSR